MCRGGCSGQSWCVVGHVEDIGGVWWVMFRSYGHNTHEIPNVCVRGLSMEISI